MQKIQIKDQKKISTVASDGCLRAVGGPCFFSLLSFPNHQLYNFIYFSWERHIKTTFSS